MVFEKIIRLDNVNNELIPYYHYKGKELIAPSTITGEKVKVQINDNPIFPSLKVLEILKESPDRIEPLCPIFHQCGGCTLLHMTYERQLKEKTEIVRRVLQGIAGIKVKVPDCLGMENPYHYRNKNQVVFKNAGNGRIISGFYEKGTHNVIDFKRCLIQDQYADEIVETIKKLMIELGIPAYNEDYQQGFLRHVLIKRSFATNQTMVVLITGKNNFPKEKEFISRLLVLHPNITTIIQNLNNSQTSAVLGEKEKVLYGNGYILDILMGKKFLVSSKSFYQVNPYQTEVLYKTALEMANLNRDEVLLDAYSGVGTIGIIASEKVKRVVSVEIVEEAVKAGIRNAKLNNIKNIHFNYQDATKYMIDSARHGSRIDVVILDPPRRGCGDLFMAAVIASKIKKVIYISCNPVTQAKDIKKLLRNGYVVTGVQPVDLFPHTSHVECIICLQKR